MLVFDSRSVGSRLFWTMIATLAALVIGLGAGPGLARADTKSFVASKTVRVTYHLPTGNATMTGRMPFVGSAACSYELPIGTLVIFPDGRPVICIDRGMLGNDGWIDVYAPDVAFGRAVEKAYGSKTTVRIYLPS